MRKSRIEEMSNSGGSKMANTIYLLTGAAGYLGSSISRALIAQNKKVRALVLNGDPAISRVPAEAEIILGDILDVPSINEFFHTPEGAEVIIIHCASMVTTYSQLSQKLFSVNVTGTKNIIDACVANRVKKLVYVSSTSVIPELPHGQIIREVDTFDPDLVTGGYGKTKTMATQLVFDAVKEHGLDASVVYPSGITGPNDYGNGFFTNFIVDCCNGKMPAGIPGSFNAVDVRDLADGVIACAENGRKGEGYIMSNSAATLRDMFRLVTQYTGARDVKLILPVFVARIIAAVSSFFSIFTGKPAVMTSFVIYNMTRNNVFSSEKAKQELGFKVRPIEETMRDMTLWLYRDGRIRIANEFADNMKLEPAA